MLEARVPPNDCDAEQSVLGAILLDPEAITKVITVLQADDFYRDNHRQIYRAAGQLFARGEPIDNVTVSGELEKMGVLDRIGGRAHLASLQGAVPTSANVVYYADMIRAKAARRQLIAAAGEIAGAAYDESRDAAEVAAVAQQLIYRVAADRATREPEPLGVLLRPWIDDLSVMEGDTFRGVATGFRDLDRCLNGLEPGYLCLVAGRAHMGKTAFSLSLGLNVARQGTPVGIFSLEMTRAQLLNRLVAMEADVVATRLRRAGNLSDDEWRRISQAAGSLGDIPMYIDDQAGMDELTLAAKARKLVSSRGAGLLVVDYLQKLRTTKDFRGSRVQEVGHLSRFLKDLAGQIGVPIVAAAQLSRAPEKRGSEGGSFRPRMSDLRDSGDLEQDADIILGLYRPDYYKTADSPGKAQIIVLKNRNGEARTVELRFDKDRTRFADLSRTEDLVA